MKSALKKKNEMKFLHAHAEISKIFFISQRGGFLPKLSNSLMKMTRFAHEGFQKGNVVDVHMINETFKPKISSIFHIELVNNG